MHEHVARAMYYLSIQLLFASMAGLAAWILTSIRGASATTKYWIWVLTALNFVVPAGALIDKLWAPHLKWAVPLGVIGGPIWDLTQGRAVVVLATIWIGGGFVMLGRLITRVRRDMRDAQVSSGARDGAFASCFQANGITVRFGDQRGSPRVAGVLRPHILLPVGIDRILSSPELDAVVLHELAHARRRDNLIRLLYEASLCALWFHPLLWLAGVRMALYRELSCDESVMQHAQGQALISALAKLAVPRQTTFLHATAASHLSHRLAHLAGTPQGTNRPRNLLLMSSFAAVVAAGIFATVAPTARCFVLKH